MRMPPTNALYPPIEAFDTGFLDVSALHSVYYEQSGNKDGQPILYLHGGPGGGTSPGDRRYFDPSHYRIILMDQRGAGKSTPLQFSCSSSRVHHADARSSTAELRENTTWDLVKDIETLREHLQVSSPFFFSDRSHTVWLVFCLFAKVVGVD